MEQVREQVQPLFTFFRDSQRLLTRCTKPDYKEFLTIVKATSIGFAVFGGIGFLVKLAHIPINQIILGA